LELFEKTKPISAKTSVSVFARKDYENKRRSGSREDKAKQSQSGPVSRAHRQPDASPVQNKSKMKEVIQRMEQGNGIGWA